MPDYRNPPPSQYFTSWEAARDAIQLWAKDEGIATVMGRTKVDKQGKTRKIWLPCSRHSKFESSSTGKRDISTGKTDCFWHICITRMPDKILWKVDPTEHPHNHELALSAIAFHQHRKRSPETLEKIKELSDASLKPQQIKTYLMQRDPNKLITKRDILNDREQMRRDNLNGLTPTQAMLYGLDTYNEEISSDLTSPERYRYTRHTHPDTDELDYLFWMHPASLELLKENCDIMLLDFTYKTNRYNMPLCHVTG